MHFVDSRNCGDRIFGAHERQSAIVGVGRSIGEGMRFLNDGSVVGPQARASPVCMCLELHDGLLERPLGLRGIFTRVSHAQRVSDLMAEHLSERVQILQGR